ncbi:hypothetical protein C5E45_27240 [Nocardia nova]|uniref:Uncharacterized protein n=1 Tax=Nocardia nova TaxID=37330 RepID=A0A2S6AIX7_9NOCA|nr:hypothetical protein C5E41_06770 [Nocardia nova]PPJ35147.1 hypothetical protein C5E45_27240 [Nocardia nova]
MPDTCPTEIVAGAPAAENPYDQQDSVAQSRTPAEFESRLAQTVYATAAVWLTAVARSGDRDYRDYRTGVLV